MCYEDFPRPSECLYPGAYLSRYSAIRFPNDIDINNLSVEDKQFVCISAMVEEKFQALD